jgi:DNA-binding Lrp family transcriptional regulator
MGIGVNKALLLGCLRNNSRKSLSEINAETGISVGTLAVSLQALERDAIVKYVSLLDPAKMGFSLKALYLLKAKNLDELVDFAKSSPNINTCSRLAEKDLLHLECFFRDMKQLDEFRETMRRLGARIVDEAFITEELKKEGFMCGSNNGCE